jgi:hypothetical protein
MRNGTVDPNTAAFHINQAILNKETIKVVDADSAVQDPLILLLHKSYNCKILF